MKGNRAATCPLMRTRGAFPYWCSHSRLRTPRHPDNAPPHHPVTRCPPSTPYEPSEKPPQDSLQPRKIPARAPIAP